MGTKRRILLAGLPVIVLGALVWFLLFPHGPPEPVYEGRPLHAWLEDYFQANNLRLANEYLTPELQIPHQPDEKSDRAEAAIRQMGTNAIPTLLRMMGQRRWAFREKIIRLLKKSPVATGKVPIGDHTLAITGFRVLGAAARPAVPALTKLLADKDFSVRIAAAEGLGCIGPEAQDAVPALIICARQTNMNVEQWSATAALGKIHGRPGLTLPVLIQNLAVTNSVPGLIGTKGFSLLALGEFGPEAKTAVPAILPFVNDPDPAISRKAAFALKKIDPEAAAKAGVK